MHEVGGPNTKAFEEMTRAELIAAIEYWQSEYERVKRDGPVLTLDPKCDRCGCSHHPGITCWPLPGGGGYYYYYTTPATHTGGQ